jgi:site-specific recombinase
VNIKFNIDNTEDFYTVTKSDHYGYNLTKHIKARSKDAKKPYSQHTLFYANLQQIAQKISWLGLKGDNVQETIDNMAFLAERLEQSLERLQ